MEYYGIYKNYVLCRSESKETIKKFFNKLCHVDKDKIEIIKSSEDEIGKDYIILFDDIEMCDISSMFSKRPMTIFDEWIIDKDFNSLMRRIDDFDLTIKELGLHTILNEDIDSKFEDALCTVIYKVSKLKNIDTKLYKKFKKSYYKNHHIRSMNIDAYIELIEKHYENRALVNTYRN